MIRANRRDAIIGKRRGERQVVSQQLHRIPVGLLRPMRFSHKPVAGNEPGFSRYVAIQAIAVTISFGNRPRTARIVPGAADAADKNPRIEQRPKHVVGLPVIAVREAFRRRWVDRAFMKVSAIPKRVDLLAKLRRVNLFYAQHGIRSFSLRRGAPVETRL